MATKNDITGDVIKTKVGGGNAYADNWDRIFGKKKKPVAVDSTDKPVEYAEDWQPTKRDKAIAQNGNVGYSEEDVNG